MTDNNVTEPADMAVVNAIMISICHGMRTARLNQGLARHEFSQRLHWSPSVLSRIERLSRVPSLLQVVRLSVTLGVRLSDLARTAEDEAAFPLGSAPWEPDPSPIEYCRPTS
jgi:ribosome-binding protein aMBF1 (putative translation factor)